MKLILFGLVSAWLIHAIDTMSGRWLAYNFCLRPRRFGGLVGIFTSPFLHGDTNHLTENSVWFAVLAGLIALQNERLLLVVTLAVALVTGLLVWLTSRSPVIGASGILFGYAGFLPAYGIFSGSGMALLIGIGALALGAIAKLKIIPDDKSVSWDTHLIGLISGMSAAYFAGVRAAELTGNL